MSAPVERRQLLFLLATEEQVGDFGPSRRRWPAGIEARAVYGREWREAAAEADAIIFQGHAEAGELAGAARRCELIVHAGAGAGGLDLEACRRLGILASSVPHYATEEYAGLVAGLLREWRPARGSGGAAGLRPRLGIVGLGCVGRAVAGAARELGYEAWAHDPYARPEAFRQAGARPAPLLDLLGVCDAVTIHAPAARSPAPAIGRWELTVMKASGALINTSPAELVDGGAVLEALASGRLGRAAMTGLEAAGERWGGGGREGIEALMRAGRLRGVDLGFLFEREALRRAVEMAAELAVEFMRGQTPRHLLIDPPLPRAMRGA